MEAATAPRDLLDGWPQKGYTGPQPWDHDKLGIPRELRDSIGSNRNTVTPTITHTLPILTSGSAHPCVHELGRKLGELGFPNSVSQGENPFGSVDQSVLSAVGSFRAQYGVEPDPSAFGGATPQGKALAASHLDPWTVEAILRAHRAEFGES
jgi:hypothetical protein